MSDVHFLDVGCADATVIQTAAATYLVDTHNIALHARYLPKNKIIEGVFVTHQHYDHYSGLSYLKAEGYSIRYLIYSPYDRRYGDASVTLTEWEEFKSLKEHFEKKGTKCFKPYRQDSFDKPYWDPSGIRVWMFGPEYGIANSPTRELHDACLVFRMNVYGTSGVRYLTFTGDASDTNLSYIAKNTANICGDILHASHHASINGADVDFIKKCAPKETVISTASGVHDNVPHPTALARYRDNTSGKVLRTDVSGNLRLNIP